MPFLLQVTRKPRAPQTQRRIEVRERGCGDGSRTAGGGPAASLPLPSRDARPGYKAGGAKLQKIALFSSVWKEVGGDDSLEDPSRTVPGSSLSSPVLTAPPSGCAGARRAGPRSPADPAQKARGRAEGTLLAAGGQPVTPQTRTQPNSFPRTARRRRGRCLQGGAQ